MTTGVVVSVFMNNISADVVRHQRAVLRKFVPSNFAVVQSLTGLSHAAALDDFMRSTQADLVLFLDIDCVPLTPDSVPTLAAHAAQGKLAGCVQRANHINNDAHLYVGPFCMAISRQLWGILGRPSFEPTARGDVGEEFTYRSQELGVSTHMLWPSAYEAALWDLTEGRKFGLNTVYEESFLHTFNVREPESQRKFIDRCRSIVLCPDSDRD